MTVDYVAAARRHIRDAHLLQHKGRLANAGQLFGISVECGLKSLLVRGGAPVDAQGNLEPIRKLNIFKTNAYWRMSRLFRIERCSTIGKSMFLQCAFPHRLLTRPYKEHMPVLDTLITGLTTLPDGRSASVLQSRLPSLASLANWKIDHRYWSESAIPLATSLQAWEWAALEMDALLDEAAAGGVL